MPATKKFEICLNSWLFIVWGKSNLVGYTSLKNLSLHCHLHD
jgi:hypothetical protein